MKLIRFKSLKKNCDYLSETNAETAPTVNTGEEVNDDDDNSEYAEDGSSGDDE